MGQYVLRINFIWKCWQCCKLLSHSFAWWSKNKEMPAWLFRRTSDSTLLRYRKYHCSFCLTAMLTSGPLLVPDARIKFLATKFINRRVSVKLKFLFVKEIPRLIAIEGTKQISCLSSLIISNKIYFPWLRKQIQPFSPVINHNFAWVQFHSDADFESWVSMKLPRNVTARRVLINAIWMFTRHYSNNFPLSSDVILHSLNVPSYLFMTAAHYQSKQRLKRMMRMSAILWHSMDD